MCLIIQIRSHPINVSRKRHASSHKREFTQNGEKQSFRIFFFPFFRCCFTVLSVKLLFHFCSASINVPKIYFLQLCTNMFDVPLTMKSIILYTILRYERNVDLLLEWIFIISPFLLLFEILFLLPCARLAH